MILYFVTSFAIVVKKVKIFGLPPTPTSSAFSLATLITHQKILPVLLRLPLLPPRLRKIFFLKMHKNGRNFKKSANFTTYNLIAASFSL